MRALSITTAALTCLALLGSSDPNGVIQVGDKAVYSFRRPMVNSMGLASLEDLQGGPVLVEFWGKRCGPCIGSAVPSTVKMAKEFGEDLGIILVESQGHSLEEVESFAYGRRWMGTHSVWTTERPFNTGSTRIPNFVLLSNEGEVLLKGNPISMHSELEEAIQDEIARSKKAPAGTPKSLHSAWKEFGKGRYAKAMAAAEKVVLKAGADAEDAKVLMSSFGRRIESKLRRVDWMVGNGHYGKAEQLLDKLSKAVKGLEDFEAQAEELEQRLSSSELQDEVKAAEALEKLEEQLNETGFDEKLVRRLQKFGDKHAGTKAANRAVRLLEIARGA